VGIKKKKKDQWEKVQPPPRMQEPFTEKTPPSKDVPVEKSAPGAPSQKEDKVNEGHPAK
jgi:hypothetical protein